MLLGVFGVTSGEPLGLRLVRPVATVTLGFQSGPTVAPPRSDDCIERPDETVREAENRTNLARGAEGDDEMIARRSRLAVPRMADEPGDREGEPAAGAAVSDVYRVEELTLAGRAPVR